MAFCCIFLLVVVWIGISAVVIVVIGCILFDWDSRRFADNPMYTLFFGEF